MDMPSNTRASDRVVATYLVTIAGSAGGFQALSQLLALLPRQFPAAIIAILHSGKEGNLAEALGHRISFPIRRVANGDLLCPGCVHIAPLEAHLVVNPDARLAVSGAPRVARLFRPSADWLFESAAASFGSRHIAVVLSGMLHDGARTLRFVRRSGGTILVQQPQSSSYPDMPVAAIATGCADAVLPIEAMPQAIDQVFHQKDSSADRAAWENPFQQSAVAS
jgi:two-component system chemotaxis response regulator CheB